MGVPFSLRIRWETKTDPFPVMYKGASLFAVSTCGPLEITSYSLKSLSYGVNVEEAQLSAIHSQWLSFLALLHFEQWARWKSIISNLLDKLLHASHSRHHQRCQSNLHHHLRDQQLMQPHRLLTMGWNQFPNPRVHHCQRRWLLG